jgi:CubicO group peptidase (beta-lactamase class C family)
MVFERSNKVRFASVFSLPITTAGFVPLMQSSPHSMRHDSSLPMNTLSCLASLNSFRTWAAVSALGWLTTSGHAAPAERIAHVESGLAPRVFAEGQPIKWTLQERMKHHRVPGVSIAVINNGKLEWARGYGTLEAGGLTPVNADTVFQAASISKPVSALAILRLIEAGKLQLDEDVNAVLKTWRVPENDLTAKEKVTLRRLLSHTAGLTVHGFRGYTEGEAVPTVAQILDGERPSNSGAIRVDLKPGTQERYSGGGYVVMHQLIRDVTDESFEAVLQSSVFKPLGMTRSTFEQPLSPAWSANAARGHRGDGKPIAGHWHTYPELAPDGLWTTATDLARFAVELQQSLDGASNKVISSAMTKQMLTRQVGTMGLGIVVAQADAALRFEHGGANEGFRCHLVAYASGRGCVVMTNSDSGGALVQEIERAIADEYEWPDYRSIARKPVPIDPSVLAEYVGSYRQPSGGPTVHVRVDPNGLAVDVDGKGFNLLAETGHRFRVVDDDSTATFFTLSGQKVLWAQNRFLPMVQEKTGPSPSTDAKPDPNPPRRFLVVRNSPSWRRPTDFEHVLRALDHEVELKRSSAMADLDLSRYTAIIVPGAQPQNDFYSDYIRHAARFDDYVAQGGTLILELNGAENTSIVLPRGVTMASNAGLENTILTLNHPIFAPFGSERVIRANAASHGYLRAVPSEALILAVESKGNETFRDRPTFVEYSHGKGRVLAACQCFHDVDNSGRGPLMATVLDYAAARSWAAGN